MEPIDQFAVGLAYSNKGAFYRKLSIEYIEKSIKFVSDECFKLISHVYPKWCLYNLLSELCEKETMLDKALDYAILSLKSRSELILYDYIRIGKIYLKMDINLCIKYYESVINSNIPESYKEAIRIELSDAKEKQQIGYKYKPRSRNQKDKLEEDIRLATIKYLNYI